MIQRFAFEIIAVFALTATILFRWRRSLAKRRLAIGMGAALLGGTGPSLAGLRRRRNVGRWMPDCTEDCQRRTQMCPASGACTKVDDRCVARTAADCSSSYNCQSFGQCTLDGDKCVAATDKDCRPRRI